MKSALSAQSAQYLSPIAVGAARCGRLLAAVVLLAGLSACQPKIELMPSPVAFTHGDGPLFNDDLEARNAPEIPIFYATNRQVITEAIQPVYTIFPSDEMRLGVAHLRVGDGSMDWEELNRLSNSTDTRRRPKISLDRMEEFTVLDAARSNVGSLRSRAFFARLNQALARSRSKDLIIFVHGANNAMHRATGQAAQFQHFTGRDAVVLTFIWPSAERVRTYFTDIRHARASVPDFARLIQMLADNTDARHIDVLAYSAGAEIASAGLGELGAPHAGESREALKQRLRLGQIYFAAPDVDTRSFADDLSHYIDLSERVSLSANLNDTALALAAVRHRASRAGRPDASELSVAQTEFLLNASHKYDFDLIKVYPSEIPGMSRTSHGFWYTNAWVSNDVLATFMRRYDPQKRGLDAKTTAAGVRYWIFPQDYEQRVVALLNERPAPARR